MPKLIFIGEHFAGRVYYLRLEKTTVGRGDGNILALHDPSVSLAHCEILVHGPEVIVRDLGSANGTFVNRVRLNGQQSQIKSGQTLRLGSVEARLELEPADEAYEASDITAVHEHGRLLREQRREQNRPKAADPSLTLDEGAECRDSDVTRVLPQALENRNPESPQIPASAANPERQPRGRIGTWIIVALLLGMAACLGRGCLPKMAPQIKITR